MRTDWADLGHYREANAKVAPLGRLEERVVFLGDSITEFWPGVAPFFPGKPYLNRGIGGQTTPQMLVRFLPDVVNLTPRVVVILAGTNDIAGNTGPFTPEMTEANLASMIELAKVNGIRVVLAAIPPAAAFWWNPQMEPAGAIVAMNARIRLLAARTGCVYLDDWTPLSDARKGMKMQLSDDGVHPNAAGYAVMAPLAAQAIAQALKLK